MRTANKNEYAQQLVKKGGEFYILMRIIHPRGVSEVIDECKDIIRQATRDGLTFEDIEKEFVVISGGEYEFKSDSFAQKIKEIFELETK